MGYLSEADRRQYPSQAYAPDGETLWWHLDKHPSTDRPYGDELKLAAYLSYEFEAGDLFTMPDVRAALGEDAPNTAEHLNRRLRELRSRDGWVIHTNKDDRTLTTGVYKIVVKGWAPGSGVDRARKNVVSAATKRRVLDGNGRRCVICGVASGEPYPGEPSTNAVLTVGHRISSNAHGSNEEHNLQPECKRCNESVREEMPDPESISDIMRDVRRLKTDELTRLFEWLQNSHRTRDRLDRTHDRIRTLSEPERLAMLKLVEDMLSGGK